MDPIDIISKYYTPGSKLFDIVVNHGRQVAKKALSAADRVSHLNCDKKFIKEAKKHLKRNGRVLIGFSSTLGKFNLIKNSLKKQV